MSSEYKRALLSHSFVGRFAKLADLLLLGAEMTVLAALVLKTFGFDSVVDAWLPWVTLMQLGGAMALVLFLRRCFAILGRWHAQAAGLVA